MDRFAGVLTAAAVVLAVALTIVLGAPAAHAACRVVEVTLTPTDDLQLAIWLEDADGNFVDTVFITEDVGAFGLGNRPGIMELNSEYRWPYGHRDSVLPVWAHRHGVTYPKIVFQNGDEDTVSHPANMSSDELHYCKPYKVGDTDWKQAVDGGTCASPFLANNIDTDKGMFSPVGETSVYPPRNDIEASPFNAGDADSFAVLNELDAVSRATPAGHEPYTLRFALPPTLPDGDYIVWVEANREFDQNAFYDYPSPVGISFADYGRAYRGQPSVVWQVPIMLDDTARVALTQDYVGYGDPDGLTGALAPADPTITTNIEGSGAQRLLLAASAEGMYRVRLTTEAVDDTVPPDPPAQLSASDVAPDSALISFLAPADVTATGEGAVSGYEIRYSVGVPLDAATFASGTLVADGLVPGAPGAPQSFALPALLPETHYWVGVRALDGCLNQGVLAVVDFETLALPRGEVDACFVATAAYGSPLAADVGRLRRFRDRALRTQALGELFVATYYTFGPAFAEVIEASDTLRALTRGALAPLVEVVR